MTEGLKIRPVESLRRQLTEQEVVNYLSVPGNTKWVKMGELLAQGNDFCVDGREKDLVLASPGGDIVLLTEAIIALGKVANKHLSPVEINQVFKWRLGALGSVYMHTDDHALGNLSKSLKADTRFNRMNFHSVAEVFAFVKNPPANLQVGLLDHLMVAENVGCGHLKLMLSHPEAYGMSRKVIQGLMASFFDKLWNGTAQEKALINYRSLQGNHSEGAVVTIQVPEETGITKDTWIPQVRPSDGKTSIFVFHPQVAQFIHGEQAKQLAHANLFPWLSRDDVHAYTKAMRHVSGEGLRETVSHLALELPKYTFELKR